MMTSIWSPWNASHTNRIAPTVEKVYIAPVIKQ